jgi:WD40 repeat protein
MTVLPKDPPDIAVLRIVSSDLPGPLAKHAFGELPQTPTVGSARGFPKFAPKSARGLPGGRIEYDQPGRVTYTSETRRSLTIDATGHHELKGWERWRGLSGGPLFAGKYIVGVMREVPEGWNGENVEAEPLGPLLQNDADGSLRALLGVELPLADSSDPIQDSLAAAYAHIGAVGSAASKPIFDRAIEKPLFGRLRDVAALDSAFTNHERGVLLLQGEAGFGKSKLAAHWAERCDARMDCKVLRHAFSVLEPVGADHGAMVANLIRQASILLGPASLGAGEPGDSARLLDRFVTLLAADRPLGNRLVIILDALDEAADSIQPWPLRLGRGVFILVTCRTAPVDSPSGENQRGGPTSGPRGTAVKMRSMLDEPRVLQQWHERALAAGLLVVRHILPPLESDGIAEWLSTTSGKQISKNDPLVLSALRASEGVPLFASFLIPDAIEALRCGVKDPFPASFDEYAQTQLMELRRRILAHHAGLWTWGEVLNLFALLCVAKAPLSHSALRILVTRHELDELDQRADRWLWRRAENGSAVSFSHPRLAKVFGGVLVCFEEEILVRAEEGLVEQCRRDWETARGATLRSYALEWLPAHLVGQNLLEQAAELLSNPTFLLMRLATVPKAATVRALAAETIALDVLLKGRLATLAEWRRFWSETEARLLLALERSSAFNLEPLEVFAQLVADRLGLNVSMPKNTGLGPMLPSANAIRLQHPCGFRHNQLLRKFKAHGGYVEGILALGDRLVSWGADGAIRFWTHQGQPLSGGDSKAHLATVKGMLILKERLVSWGIDGAIKFWTHQGEPLPGGACPLQHRPNEHTNDKFRGFRPISDRSSSRVVFGVSGGVLIFGERLVSWGLGVGLRLWTDWGERVDSGDLQSHSSGIRGAVVIDDQLLGWDGDGTVRFFTPDGKARAGSTTKAKFIAVDGILVLHDQLVTWGSYTGIRFWTLQGDPRFGDSLRGLRDKITGVLQLNDRLVSWGEVGAIRFWTHDGEPAPGGDQNAHRGGVGGILVTEKWLVSWGGDGAIRFWTHGGIALYEDSMQAYLHDTGVKCLIALSDRLVTGGNDGTIRMWALPGQSTRDVKLEKHRGEISGVVGFKDRLVSWGKSKGEIRFWTRHGEVAPGGHPEAHPDGVRNIIPLDDRLISWGNDGAIRFWTRDGKLAPGGDAVAHSGRVQGVLPLDGKLMSWGGEQIRFWTSQGNPLPNYSQHSCPTGMTNFIVFADRLVSWGGAEVRFWTHKGELTPGGDQKAHRGRVGGVLPLDDRLASWGAVDGAVKFWTPFGETTSGGHREAHSNGVAGMAAVGDQLVSWGTYDGSIRLWTRHGRATTGGESEAHRYGVKGVLPLEDGFVSWGDDGAVRFWTTYGEAVLGGDREAHRGGVEEVLRVGDRLLSLGNDWAVRFWTMHGAPLPQTWIAPEKVELIAVADGQIWVVLRGVPYKLNVPSH